MKKFIQIFMWGRRNSKYLPSILALFMAQLFVLSGFSQVLAASVKPDIAEGYQELNTGVSAVTGDTFSGANTSGTSLMGTFAIPGVIVLGYDSFESHAEAVGISEDELSAEARAGLLGVTDGYVMSLLSNPPGVDIPSHLARQWIPGADSSSSSVLAADTGYSHLVGLGVEDIWVMFRNLAYAGFVLILVATGFMIMFRSKIGGQTAVTVMNSLPSIVVGLILVTFSFAIVGLVIDLSRLLTAVISNFLASELPDLDVVPLGGPMQMAKYAFTASLDATWDFGKNGFLGANVIEMVRNIGSVVIKLILTVILGFVAVYAAFKLFFSLVMCYIRILIDLVLGPIYILMGSLPGSRGGITDWVKRLLVNSLTFPIVFFMINLFRYIGDPSITNPLTGNFAGFMGGGQDIGDPVVQLKGAVVLVGYFLAASTPAIVQDLFQLKESPGSVRAAQDVQKSLSKVPLIGGMFAG